MRVRLRSVARALGAFCAVLGMVLLLFVPEAGAGTVYNPNPPSAGVSCDLAFSTTNSWADGSISVDGTCGGPALAQNLAPEQGSASCMSGADPFWCAYDTSQPLTVAAIYAWYWTGTVELDFVAMEATRSPAVAGAEPGSTCGFNGSSIDFNSSGLGSTYGSLNPNVQDATATAELQNSLPQAGTAESAPFDRIVSCDTGTNAAVWVGVSTSSTNSGAGMAYLQNNGWCNAGYHGNGECTLGTHTGYTISGPDGGLWLGGTFSPTSTWSGGAAPCTLYSVTGDGSEPVQQANSSTPYSLSFSSADAIVAVDDAYTTGSSVDVYGKSFVLPTLADMRAGGDLSSPGIISFQAETGDVVNPDFWCYSSSGGWVQWGTFGSIQSSGGACTGSNCAAGGGGPGSVGSGSGGAFSLGSCLDGTGWSWTDPTTWVLGALKDLACIGQWLFVPDSASLSRFESTFGVSSNAPSGSVGVVTFLGALTKTAAVFPYAEVSQIQTAADGGGCSLPGTLNAPVTLDGQAVSACTILDSYQSVPANASSAIALLKLVETAFVYLGAALLIWHFLRRVLSS